MTPHPTLFLEGSQPSCPSRIPPELMDKARTRLMGFARLMAIISFFGLLFGLIVLPRIMPERGAAGLGPLRATQLLVILFSTLLYLAGRDRRIGTGLLLNAGLVYEVFFSFVGSASQLWGFYTATGHYQLVTMASLIIIAYPLIVPSPPLTTLIAALASGATVPLALFAVTATTGVPAGAGDYVLVTFFPAIAVAIAVYGSRVIYGLNIDFATACQIGSYRLESLLGRGGMGEVWRARHRFLARPAAVKLVRPDFAGSKERDADAVLKRFEREAQATALLQSPHTIQVYDFGVSDGVFYYVMELLDGLDLESLVSKIGPVPHERAIHILRQICDSLMEAHSKGLIHRDVKPANIFVCRYGLRNDFVKVLDFGLVKSSPGFHDASARLTAENVVSGTPAFMAPEQILGREVDSRSDIYAVGCVAYWLLTGRMVFEGTTSMDIMTQHAQVAPAPPSERTELPVPPELDAVVLSCLEKEPGKRPQTARDLDLALRRCAGAGGWTEEQARHWWETHRPAAPATASPS